MADSEEEFNGVQPGSFLLKLLLCQGVNASADTLQCTFQVTVTGECGQQTTGACCFGQTACDDVTEEECLHMGGVYFGDGTNCAVIDCGLDCVRPPRGLTAWWPLDGESGGVTPNLADPAAGGTLIGGPTGVIGSYVMASYLFDGADDYANVPDGPGIDLGTSDFSIDFWIQTTDGQGLNAILDKRAASPVRGYRVFLQDGYPGLSMADGSIGTYALSAANGGRLVADVAHGGRHRDLIARQVGQHQVGVPRSSGWRDHGELVFVVTAEAHCRTADRHGVGHVEVRTLNAEQRAA